MYLFYLVKFRILSIDHEMKLIDKVYPLIEITDGQNTLIHYWTNETTSTSTSNSIYNNLFILMLIGF